MSNYTKTTNFASKDNLSPGNPLKIVKGAEIDTEFNNIQTAVGTKTDNASANITGGSITGITDLAVADGGTGASTATAALNNLLPSQSGNDKKYLQTDGTNATWDAVSLSTADITGTLPVANGGTGVTSSTGTGSVVLSNSPTLVTPALGTPASGVATNLTGLPISTGVSGLGTGVATFLGTPSSANLASAVTDETGSGALVFANSPTLVTPALGTPSALVGTNITGTASGLTAGNVTTNANLTGAITSTGNATSLGSFSSANLLAALTDETGSGSAVFATSPTLVTPILGTPTSATLTNATGLPISTGVSGLGTGVATALAVNVGSAGAPLVNGGVLGTPSGGTATNLTGLPLSTGVTGTLPVANGGTGTATPSIVAGTNVTVTGTWPNQTIAASGGGGTGDVVGPASSTDNAFARFDSTTGKLLQNSTGATLSDTGAAVFTGALDVLGNSTAGSNLKLYEDTDNGTNYVAFKAPDTIASNVTWTLPAADGTSAQVLSTNGSGTLSWATAGGGGGSAATPTALGTVYGNTPSAGILSANLGYQAGASTTGDRNVIVGYQAHLNGVGSSTITAIGYQAIGGAGTNIQRATAVGFQSLYSHAGSGGNYQNTAVGWQSLYALNTGDACTAVGHLAGTANTTGSSNTFIGASSGSSNSTGLNNTLIGVNSGTSITTGSKNSILGAYNGNQDSLDIRTASNYAVISDGDGNRLLTTANGQTVALDSAVPNSGTGITFPATQSASTDANTLDDYEEGTWTPTATNVTITSATGTYTKIGRYVYITFYAVWPNNANGSAVLVQGLPFTSRTLSGGTGGAGIGYNGSNTDFYATVNSNTTNIEFYQKLGAQPTNANFSTKDIIFSISYLV